MSPFSHFSACSALLWTLFGVAHPVGGRGFRPRGLQARSGSIPQRRANCEPAGPDVNEDRIIEDACNQNPQNNFNVCYNEIVAYVQRSAAPTCAHYYQLYNDCLVLNSYNETMCSDSKLGYVDCSNYTLQAYAYCGCYYALPADISTCANVQLEVRPNTPASAVIGGPKATSDLLTGAISPTPTGGGQSLIPFLSFGPSTIQDSATASSTLAATASGTSAAAVSSTSTPSGTHPVVCGPEGGSTCYAPSSPSSTSALPTTHPTACGSGGGVGCSATATSSDTFSSPSFDPSKATLTLPPRPSGTQSTSTVTSVISTTGVTTITSCPSSLPSCIVPISTISTYTTQYTTTLYSCEGGCTPPPMPTATPAPQINGQVTSTSVSTAVVTKTSTIASCAPTVMDCPANLPATSTYVESTTKTLLLCDGGCTGPAPAGAKDVCVRRRTLVLKGLLG